MNKVLIGLVIACIVVGVWWFLSPTYWSITYYSVGTGRTINESGFSSKEECIDWAEQVKAAAASPSDTYECSK